MPAWCCGQPSSGYHADRYWRWRLDSMALLEEGRAVVTRWKRRHLPVWSARLDGALRIAYGALVVARRNSHPIGGPTGRDREGLEAGKPGDRRVVRAAGQRDHP